MTRSRAPTKAPTEPERSVEKASRTPAESGPRHGEAKTATPATSNAAAEPV